MSGQQLDRIYAKSANENGDKEPLAEHTIHDIEVFKALVRNLPFSTAKKRRITRDGTDAIAFHDVGKAATGFQQSLEKGAKHWGKRHEIVSAALATSLGLSDAAIFAILTHHKQIPTDGTELHGCLPYEQLPFSNHITPLWLDMAEEFNDNIPLLRVELERICNSVGRDELPINQLQLVSFSHNLKNWLNRNTQAKDKDKGFPYKQREYFSLIRGLVMAADHIASGGYMPPRIPALKDYAVTTYQLYGFQAAASKAIGNLILRAPTGSGKTGAALLWAQLNQLANGRLFYALPNIASINAMYLRLENIFQKGNVGLLHSRAASVLYSIFESDNIKERQALAWDIASLVRKMFYPIRVCTPHQILRYSLQGKGWEAMLSEFPHSVFVFDEIHAYNPHLTGLTMATVRYIITHKARCMFLTATLPTFIRKLIEQEIPGIQFLEPSPSNESDRKILEQKRHTIQVVDGSIMDNIDLIARQSANAKSTLVVCNHVPTAQAVYRKLSKKIQHVGLLHSRFTRKDRNEKEQELRSGLPTILVATQVVEVSLDVDFQQGFTEPAPIDAIVQRMGRINRRAKLTAPAPVHIFTMQYSDSGIPYKEDLRDISIRVMKKLSSEVTEEELNDAADKVYGSGYTDKDKKEFDRGLNYEKLKYFNKYLVAGTNQNWIDEVIDKQEGTSEVLPEQLQVEYNDLRNAGKIIEANDLLVPVSNRRIKQLFEDNLIIDDRDIDLWILTGCSYNSEVGLDLDNRHTSLAGHI
jgi:CRISPR-associated endonuclease/helicase Cas3